MQENGQTDKFYITNDIATRRPRATNRWLLTSGGKLFWDPNPAAAKESGERGLADMIKEVYGWKVNSDFTEN